MTNEQSEDRIVSRIVVDQPYTVINGHFVSEMNLTSFKDSFKLIYRRNRGRSAKSTRSKGDSNDFVEKEKSIRPETVLKK